jgi:hypothetical protein
MRFLILATFKYFYQVQGDAAVVRQPHIHFFARALHVEHDPGIDVCKLFFSGQIIMLSLTSPFSLVPNLRVILKPTLWCSAYTAGVV